MTTFYKEPVPYLIFLKDGIYQLRENGEEIFNNLLKKRSVEESVNILKSYNYVTKLQ